MDCPYCGEPTRRVSGRKLYTHRRDLWHRMFIVCELCDARVGTHKNGDPLGMPAKAALRRRRSTAHEYFDRIWRQGLLTRTAAYVWLAEALGLPVEQTHIGQFDEQRCERVIRLSREFLKGQDASNAT